MGMGGLRRRLLLVLIEVRFLKANGVGGLWYGMDGYIIYCMHIISHSHFSFAYQSYLRILQLRDV